jgi:L-amino acid N-acyltransferase YncA
VNPRPVPTDRIRPARPQDAAGLAALLGRIIDEGDKTAIDSHLDASELSEWFITGKHVIGCYVAETGTGALVGFQAYERYHEDLPAGWADIATFVDRAARGSGIGRRLFAETLAHAATTGTSMLRAVIRRENESAIAYYRACGFGGSPTGDGGAPTGDGGSTNARGSVVLVRPVVAPRADGHPG